MKIVPGTAAAVKPASRNQSLIDWTATDKLLTANDFTSTDGILEYHPIPITVVSLTGYTAELYVLYRGPSMQPFSLTIPTLTCGC